MRKALITSLTVMVEISLYWILPSKSVKIHYMGWKLFENVIVSIILISLMSSPGGSYIPDSSGSSRLDGERALRSGS